MSRVQKQTILVVDDNVLVREVVGERLRAAGFEVVEAADADKAKTALEGLDNIDLVFSDIDMPGSMNGSGLALWILKRYPAVKVLLTSGASIPDPQDPEGEVPFLPKPYQFRELVTHIGRLLNARR